MRLIFRLGFALTLLIAALAVAHPHAAGDRDDELGWAILHEDHRRTSTLHDLDEIEDLQSRFGDDLLYIRDGGERYVITDRALIERAEEAAHRIVDPAKAMAKAEARLAVRQAHGAKAWVKLQNAESQLRAAIEKQERRGDDTEELRDALERVREELGEIKAHGERRPVSDSERREMERRRDGAHERLAEALSEMRSEIRDILREAKERDLARRVR